MLHQPFLSHFFTLIKYRHLSISVTYASNCFPSHKETLLRLFRFQFILLPGTNSSYSSIPLAPEAACVGLEIRVVENDSGKQVIGIFRCMTLALFCLSLLTNSVVLSGTRKLHRRTLEALRLGKCNRAVMRWNTPTVRGMLQQVKRLVVVVTEEMFKARKQKQENEGALRPPFVVSHLPPCATDPTQQAI
ncbi:uncharacterized protein [Rutidosis leptorrhynchoides]|uniref:uncharacterized protein n=1 Tax=Rutidosis leptorrhynchoides TaxID=125765 RepID=UPI003A99212F